MNKSILNPWQRGFITGLGGVCLVCLIAGLSWGIREPYIASDAVQYLFISILPACAGSLYLVLYFKKDSAGGPSLFHVVRKRSGYIKATLYIFSGVFLFVGFAAVAGNIGWKPLTVYLAEWDSGEHVTIEGKFVRKLGVRPSFGALGRVEVDLEGDYLGGAFAWPKRSIEMMSHCPESKVLISGKSNAFGIVVDDVECKLT